MEKSLEQQLEAAQNHIEHHLEVIDSLLEKNERLKVMADTAEAKLARMKERSGSLLAILLAEFDFDGGDESMSEFAARKLQELLKENEALSAGVCEHLVGDERGHGTCEYRKPNYAKGHEAEELRRGLEKLLEHSWSTVGFVTDAETLEQEIKHDIRKLLDRVDARDSLDYVVDVLQEVEFLRRHSATRLLVWLGETKQPITRTLTKESRLALLAEFTHAMEEEKFR